MRRLTVHRASSGSFRVPAEKGEQSKLHNSGSPLTFAALRCRTTPGYDKLASWVPAQAFVTTLAKLQRQTMSRDDKLAGWEPAHSFCDQILPKCMWLLPCGPRWDGQIVLQPFPLCEAQLRTAQPPCSSILGTAGEHAAQYHSTCGTLGGLISLASTILHDM